MALENIIAGTLAGLARNDMGRWHRLCRTFEHLDEGTSSELSQALSAARSTLRAKVRIANEGNSVCSMMNRRSRVRRGLGRSIHSRVA